MRFRIYRYDPDADSRPRMQDYELPLESTDRMVLDALVRLKEQDDSISFRRSCREGVCGSDAMNINGRNGLACVTPLKGIAEPVTLAPLPGFPVVRDLVVDMTQFFAHYHAVRPYLVNNEPLPERERLQSPEDRDKLNELYECILCACCSAFCPSYWWNPDKFIGPAGLLQAQRFIVDSRDRITAERLEFLDDVYKLYRCRTIMNCTEVCPKGLSPARAIEEIKVALVRKSV
ncbi:MAG: succinate dehydrogenase iron-sulfur subunit [Gammaproteobacteria bacterium]|nr:succinate dehydrogenase iron-sulfur subunit [Gammaproteobacteria bacterium]